MNLVDTHCHLIHEQFKDDIDAVVQRAKDAGFSAIICSGVNPPTNRQVLELSKKHDIVKAALGIYPIDALGIAPDGTGLARYQGKINIDEEFTFFNEHKNAITAIGEVGLDYKFGADHKEQQKANFKKIIQHTEKIGKPIVVHTRRAELDCVELLESSSIKHIILHSFEAKKTLIRRAADNGWYFSVPTNVVRSQQFQTLLSIVPLQQVFTETDAPWLSPFKEADGTPIRNEPAFVAESLKKFAEIKEMSKEDVAAQIWKNYVKVFQ
jgi:TatD DNase family protein